MRLESVQLGVPDVAAASAEYTVLLGLPPVELPDGVARFQLRRGAVDLVPDAEGRRTITFVTEPKDPPLGRQKFHGLPVRVVPAAATEPVERVPAGAVDSVDHVVVQTPDAERAIALWRDKLGLRLAFDETFPKRRLRLLFFRSGGMTFEFATSDPPPPDRTGPDQLYGISYRVMDLGTQSKRLVAAGLDVSDLRPGNKLGTRVLTVRSGTAGVPTLFLEEPSRPA
jgi:catechol 2,3-dioxygenase-like lactoylglutathione lyase family enzyme